MKITPMNETIAIVGAGLIGRAWAIVFARAGCQVRLHDAVPDALAACQALLLDNISDLAQHGLIDEAPAEVLARITPVPTLPKRSPARCWCRKTSAKPLKPNARFLPRWTRSPRPIPFWPVPPPG